MAVVYRTLSASNFIPQGKIVYTFKTFQGLSELVREALVHVTKLQIAGMEDIGVRDVVEYMVSHWDQNQSKAIGELTDEMDRFTREVVHCRMVRCYVDMGCNMMAAKLAWRVDY